MRQLDWFCRRFAIRRNIREVRIYVDFRAKLSGLAATLDWGDAHDYQHHMFLRKRGQIYVGVRFDHGNGLVGLCIWTATPVSQCK